MKILFIYIHHIYTTCIQAWELLGLSMEKEQDYGQAADCFEQVCYCYILLLMTVVCILLCVCVTSAGR